MLRQLLDYVLKVHKANFVDNYSEVRVQGKNMLREEDKPMKEAIVQNFSATDLLQRFAPFDQAKRNGQVIHLIRVAAYIGKYELLKEIVEESDLCFERHEYKRLIIKTMVYGTALAGRQSIVMALLDSDSIEDDKNKAIYAAAQGGHSGLLTFLMEKYPGKENEAVKGLIDGGHFGNQDAALLVFSFINSKKIRTSILNEAQRLAKPWCFYFWKPAYKFDIDFNVLREQAGNITEIMLYTPTQFEYAKMCAEHFSSYTFLLFVRQENNVGRENGIFRTLDLTNIIAGYLASRDISEKTLQKIGKIIEMHSQPEPKQRAVII